MNKYTTDIKTNAEIARQSESIAQCILQQLYPQSTFESIHDEQALWHYGDIMQDGWVYYDVKDDGCIAKTGNVFCELGKKWKYSGEKSDGWMKNGHYDYVCVLDQISCKMYVLDFRALKKVYREGRYISGIDLGDNYTCGYIVTLNKLRKRGVIECEVQYQYDSNGGIIIC